jgi:autotransporter-associated beta strand protein
MAKNLDKRLEITHECHFFATITRFLSPFNHHAMTTNPNPKSIVKGFLPLLFVTSSAFSADFNLVGGDVLLPGSWSPAPTISGSSVSAGAGNRLLIGSTNVANNTAILSVTAGSSLVQTVGGQPAYRPVLELAGTGADGLGAFRNIGTDWANVQDVRLTGNALVRVESGGWRQQDHGSGTANQLVLNGNTLTIDGGNNFYLVNTNIVGPGVIDVKSNNGGDNINFEGSAVLPANVTLKLASGAKHSSWDGGGRVMAGNVEAAGGSVIEVRNNDLHKTYTGQITLTGGPTSFRTENAGDGNGSLDINGKVTGAGELVKDGSTSVDLGTSRGMVFLNNTTNDYSGGTRVETGVLKVGGQGALPAGKITVNGGTLDLNGTTANMTSGLIKAAVSGGIVSMEGPGVKEIQAGAAVSSAVELSGGVLKPNHDGGNNILGNGVTGNLLVSGDATLKPFQSPPTAAQAGLAEWNRVGPDVYTDVGTTGATFRGIRTGIDAIDSTAKPYGDNNKFIYTGEIVNSTGAPMTVSFAEQYDDQIRVKVNGTTVLLDNGWNAATQSAAVTLNPGANTVEFSSFDGVGGAGPNSGWTKGIGIAFGDVDSVDDAAYGVIRNGLLPAGLALQVPSIDNTANRTENKGIEIDGGVVLTVDTTDMQGRTYTMSGAIIGGGGLTKTGPGSVILTGTNTYSGATTISQGTLALGAGGSLSPSSQVIVSTGAVFDATAAGGVTIPVGQTLKGTGTAIGDVTVLGTLAPGNSIGTINVTGSVMLSGTSDFEFNPSSAADLLNATGTVTYGGTLNFINLGANPLMGDTFNLFDAAVFAGSFATVNLPSYAPGDSWTNNLGVNGTLTYIPESSSSLLALIGGIGFVLRRRRKA